MSAELRCEFVLQPGDRSLHRGDDLDQSNQRVTERNLHACGLAELGDIRSMVSRRFPGMTATCTSMVIAFGMA